MDGNRVSMMSLREALGQIIDKVVYRDEGFIITRRGQDVALLLPMRAESALVFAALHGVGGGIVETVEADDPL